MGLFFFSSLAILWLYVIHSCYYTHTHTTSLSPSHTFTSYFHPYQSHLVKPRLSVIVGLELSTEAWWDHQWVHNHFPFSWIYHQTSSILRDGVPRPLFLQHLAVDCPIFVQIKYGHSNSVMMMAVSCPDAIVSQPFSILALTLFPTSSTVFPEWYKPPPFF